METIPGDAREHSLFLSHAGKDTRAAKELANAIQSAPSAREAGLKVWLDQRDLTPGIGWQRQIEEAIRESTAFAVLVSKTSGVVNWVQQEVRVALDRAAQESNYPFIPVFASGSEDLKALSPFARQYQAVIDPINNPEALKQLIRAATRAESLASTQLVDTPFVGLRPYKSSEAHLFFGRSEETEELIQRVKDNRLVMVVGDSGSGKSSLVLAGLEPRFRGGALHATDTTEPEETCWLTVETRPGSAPFETLADDVAVALEQRGCDAETQSHHKRRLRSLTQIEEMGQRREDVYDALVQGAPPDSGILFIVNQFEELIVLNDERTCRKYIDCLLYLSRTEGRRDIRMVLTMRWDYYNLCSQYEDFYEIFEDETGSAKFLLRGMKEKGLRESIVEPLRRAGVEDPETSEAAFIKKVLNQVTERPGDLTLLQVALQQAWRTHRRFEGGLSAAYDDFGGVTGAIARVAEGVYSKLDPDDRQLMKTSFLRLVQLGDGDGTVRRAALRAEFSDDAWRLLGNLATERNQWLVVVGGGKEGTTAELPHDALVTQWPKFRRWIKEEAPFKREHDRLIASYYRLPRSRLVGLDLQSALDLKRRRPGWLSEGERRYIAESKRWRSLWRVGLLAAAGIILCLIWLFVQEYAESGTLKAAFGLRDDFDSILRDRNWVQTRLEETTAIIERMGELDPAESKKLTLRRASSIEEYVESSLPLSSGEETAKRDFEVWIRLVEEAIPVRGKELRGLLEERFRFEVESHSLPPWADIASVFGPEYAQHLRLEETPTGKSISRARATERDRLLATAVSTGNEFDIEVDFERDVSKPGYFAIFVDYTSARGAKRAYEFALTTKMRGDPSTPFHWLFVSLNDRILQSQTVPLTSNRHTIRVVRSGDRFVFSLNRVSLEVHEEFRAAPRRRGFFAFHWPPDARMRRLSISNRNRNLQSPTTLERADSSFLSGDYHAARDLYRTAQRTERGRAKKAEAQYKIGLCERCLRNLPESRTAFEELRESQETVWRARALSELALFELDHENTKESEAYLFLAASVPEKEFLFAVPEYLRREILSRHFQQAGIGELGSDVTRTLKFDADRIAKVESILAVFGLLRTPGEQSVALRLQLVRLYGLAGRDENARDLLEVLMSKLLVDPQSAMYADEILHEYAWVTLRTGSPPPERAAETIRSWVGRMDGIALEARLDLVRIAWVQGELDSAERLVQNFVRELEALERGFSVSLALAEAHLVWGFLKSDRDEEEEAEKKWARGFSYVRKRFQGELLHSLLGSLSGEMTTRDAEEVIAAVGSKQPLLGALFSRLSLPAFKEEVQTIWQSEKGREYARKMARLEISAFEYFGIQAPLGAAEVLRRIGFPGGGPDERQRRVLWRILVDLLETYRRGEIQPTQIGALIVTGWNGVGSAVGAFTWTTLSKNMNPDLATDMGYLLAERSLFLGDRKNAIRILRECKERGTQNAELRQLVDDRLSTVEEEQEP